MHKFINLVEGKQRSKGIQPVVDKIAQAQALYNKTHETIQKLNRSFGLQWSQDWITDFKKEVETNKKKWNDNQKDELNYDEEYTVQPYILSEHLEEILNEFWSDIKDKVTFEISDDINYRWENYFDDHSDVEASDQISLMQSEKDLLRIIRMSGFYDLETMEQTLTGIKNFAEDAFNYSDLEHSFSTATENFIGCAIPFILTVCRTYGAKPKA